MLSPKELSDVFEAYDAITEAYANLSRAEVTHKAIAMGVTSMQADGTINDIQTAMLLAYNDGVFAAQKIGSGEYQIEEEE